MMGERVGVRIEQAIGKGIFPGCVIGVTDHGVRDVRAFGAPT
jgi:hypothetical protein